MKHTIPLFVLVGVAGVLVPVLAVFAQSSSSTHPKPPAPEPCCTVSTCTKCSPEKASSGNDKLIEELTAILKETKSPQTFLVTVKVLGVMGSEAKYALPAIIRNAERLELLDDLFNSGVENGNKIATEELGKALEMILVDKYSARRRVVQPPPQVYYAPAPSAYPTAPAYSNVPPTPAPGPTPLAPATKPVPDKNTKTGRLVPQAYTPPQFGYNP